MLEILFSCSAIISSRMGLSLQDDFQHDFARMTDEADSSVVLTEP